MKSGFVTVIGIPNAGKSSLVNALVHESVSIVTAKPQTTRKRTQAILTKPGVHQVIFVDTPGVVASDAGLNPYLKHELEEALKDKVDVVVAAIAPWEFSQPEKPWSVTVLEQIKCPKIFVSTQVDKIGFRPDDALKVWEKWGMPGQLHFTSAKNGFGLDDLKERIITLMPEGQPFYDEEIYTTQTMREMAGEVVRKHCFEALHEEVPYGLATLVRRFKEGETLLIEVDLVLAKEGHKPIVIGKGGQNLKQIGSRARLELEEMFQQKIFLKLQVVVKPHWIRDRSWLEELGYGS